MLSHGHTINSLIGYGTSKQYNILRKRQNTIRIEIYHDLVNSCNSLVMKFRIRNCPIVLGIACQYRIMDHGTQYAHIIR